MKSKFFLCIRPMVAETVEEDGKERKRFVVVSKERGSGGGSGKISAVERSSSVNSNSGRENYLKVDRGGGGSCRHGQRVIGGGGGGSCRRGQRVVGGGSHIKHKTFSQAIKAVLFEVSLRKSVRERQLRQLMPRSISHTTTNLVGSDNDNEPVQSQPEPQTQQRPISCTPSLSPSNVSNCDKVNVNSTLNYAMYLLVISLFVTVFWGKVFGIMCTLMWLLYVGPRRSCDYGGEERSGNCAIKLPETEEEMVVYKKRVIMGGLLERNNRRDGERVLKF